MKSPRNPWEVSYSLGLEYRGDIRGVPRFVERLEDLCEELGVRIVRKF